MNKLKMNDSIFLTPPHIWVLCEVGGAGAGGGGGEQFCLSR